MTTWGKSFSPPLGMLAVNSLCSTGIATLITFYSEKFIYGVMHRGGREQKDGVLQVRSPFFSFLSYDSFSVK